MFSKDPVASGQQTPNGDQPTTRALPSLRDVLNAIFIILAAIGALVLCSFCCDIFCPRKSDHDESSGVVVRQGSQKAIIPTKYKKKQEIEVIHLRRISGAEIERTDDSGRGALCDIM
ncbi:hypothetical protein MTO96_010251 [Rhipicephalus appendiculatus]